MSAGNFRATLFLDTRIESFKLCDLLQKATNGYIPKEVLGSKVALFFPFEETDGIIYDISEKRRRLKVKMPVKVEEVKRQIVHGDYISIKDEQTGVIYSVLFTEYCRDTLNYRQYRMDVGRTVSIGRLEENDIAYSINGFISRRQHVVLKKDKDSNILVDVRSDACGVYKNGIRVTKTVLSPGDELYIMGLSIYNMGGHLFIKDVTDRCRLTEIRERITFSEVPVKEETLFVRSPRIIKSLDTEAFEIDSPPDKKEEKQMPVIFTMGPSLTMSMAMLVSLGVNIANLASGGSATTIYTSGAMAVSMLLGAVLWPTLTKRYKAKIDEKEEAKRQEKYRAYIEQCSHMIEKQSERNQWIMEENLNPAPEMLVKFATDEKHRYRLWERSYSDDDFLNIRIGTGTIRNPQEIIIEKEKFSLSEDDLAKLPMMIKKKYQWFYHAPVSLSLDDQSTVGLLGNARDVLNMASLMVLNLTALYDPSFVKLVMVLTETQIRQMSWILSLPHLWNTSHTLRYLAVEKGEVHTIFSEIDETVQSRVGRDDKENSKKEVDKLPRYICFIGDKALVQNEPLLRYLEDSENEAGISAVFMYGSMELLPGGCRTMIQSASDGWGIYSREKNHNRLINFEPDRLAMARYTTFGHAFDRMYMQNGQVHTAIPDRVSFLEMYHVGNISDLDIENRWQHASTEKSIAVPVGTMEDGHIFNLDIHEAYHGCHGLVAGMTGSGKSEFLQGYLLSLMIHFSPEDVALVLVDFKGGDMARPFMNVPHLAGTISNLSGSTLYRAMVSLEAEIAKRQKMMNTAAEKLGIDKIDVNSYQRYFKEGQLTQPMPHLVIMIDEFAQLKTHFPEFLTQLINVAQVGRSLGIHLILATQKPSGVVDAQIWSNSRFRVCLKVLSRADSMDMLDCAEAAMIKQPGRFYVRVGYDEIFTQAQAGYGGAQYVEYDRFTNEENVEVQMVDHTVSTLRSIRDTSSGTPTGKTQMETVVGEIIRVGRVKGKQSAKLWCMPLEKVLYGDRYLEAIGKNPSGFHVPIAMGDFVADQEQKPIIMDLTEAGHVAVFGLSGTGKTIFIQTIITGMAKLYSPKQWQFCLFDLGSRGAEYYRKLPHCRDIIYMEEKEVDMHLDMLAEEIEQRRDKLAKLHCGSWKEYYLKNDDIPMLLVFVDHYSAISSKYYRLENKFTQLVAGGKAVGMYFVITGNSRTAIGTKVMEQISSIFMLNMGEDIAYRVHLNIKIPFMPEETPGRGLTVIDEKLIEFQTFLYVESESETERMAKVITLYDEINTSWHKEDVLKTSMLKNNSYEDIFNEYTLEINSEDLLTKKSHTTNSYNDDDGFYVPYLDEHEKFEPNYKNVETISTNSVTKAVSDEKTTKVPAIKSDGTKKQHLITGYLLESGEAVSLPEWKQWKTFVIASKECTHMTAVLNSCLKRWADILPGQVFVADMKRTLGYLPIKCKVAFNEKSFDEMMSDIEADSMEVTLIIADFDSFYGIISDSAAARLQVILQNREKRIHVITCCDTGCMEKYSVMKLFDLLVKTPFGLLCESDIQHTDKRFLNTDFVNAVNQEDTGLEEGCGIYYENGNISKIRYMEVHDG